MWDRDERAGWRQPANVSTRGSRELRVDPTVQLTADLAYIFLRWSIPSFTWLQAVTLAALLAALSAKDRVFTWCAAVQRPGPPRWNWNVNAYWAAVNTCNPAGPWGGIRKAEEIETTQGGPLSTEVSCLCSWRQPLTSFNTKHHTSTCPPCTHTHSHRYHPLGTKGFTGARTAAATSLRSKLWFLEMLLSCYVAMLLLLLGGGFGHNVFFSPGKSNVSSVVWDEVLEPWRKATAHPQPI